MMWKVAEHVDMDYLEILDSSFVETPVDDFHLPSDDLLSNLSRKMKLKVFLRQVLQ